MNLPCRRSDVLVRTVAGDTVVYDQRIATAHCIEGVAAGVFDDCDGLTSVEACAARLGVTVDMVAAAVRQLEGVGVLAARPGLSRRTVLTRGAMVGTAAIVLPAIATLVAPVAAAAASGGGGGGPPSRTLVALGSDGWTTKPEQSGSDTNNAGFVPDGQIEGDPTYYTGVIGGTSGQTAPFDIIEYADLVIQRTLTVTGPTTLSFAILADDTGEGYLYDTGTNTVAIHLPGDWPDGSHGQTDVTPDATYAVPSGTFTYLFSARARNNAGAGFLDAEIKATP